jgi:DUF1680 family protein
MRQIALVGHYAATVDLAGLQIHQYMSANVPFENQEGRRALLRMETDYPWAGDVRLTVVDSDDEVWRLSLRVPGWCTHGRAAVNGESTGVALGAQYLELERKWRPGDVVNLRLPMEPRLTAPSPRIDAVRGCLAIERGPIVYCLEQTDQPAAIDLLDLRITPDAEMQTDWRPDLLGGVIVIETLGSAVDVRDWEDRLYHPVHSRRFRARPAGNVKLAAVPYYAWANRGPGAMRVWIPTSS